MSFVASLRIPHSELFSGSSAVLVLSEDNSDGYTVRSFFPFRSFFFNRHALVWPLELGKQTGMPGWED